MEINKDIADIRAAEEILHKKKKYLLCYHNFNVKNCKKRCRRFAHLDCRRTLYRGRP